MSSFENIHAAMKDTIGRYRTQSLFWEYRTKGYDPFFTIKDQAHTVDGTTYPSLKQIYMSYDHVPGFEYDFAIDVFGSWDHWIKLSSESLLKALIAEWREELDIRIKADAIKAMMKASQSNDARGIAAAKYLADKGYMPSSKRGRPSKEEVEREKRIQAGINKDLQDDMERLGLSVINGSK